MSAIHALQDNLPAPPILQSQHNMSVKFKRPKGLGRVCCLLRCLELTHNVASLPEWHHHYRKGVRLTWVHLHTHHSMLIDLLRSHNCCPMP